MNIQVEKDQVSPLLGQVQSLLERRTNMPVLENIMLKTEKNGIFLYASDSELSFSACLPGRIKSEGCLIVNGKRLFDIIRELSTGSISLKGESGKRIQVKKDRSVFQIQSMKQEDFPVFPPIQSKKFQNFQVKDILSAIDRTIYCTSLDDSRYHLMGVLCEPSPNKSGYRFVATDGYRMSFVDISVTDFLDFKDSVIIPKKALQEIKKMLSAADEDDTVKVAVEAPRMVICFEDQKLSARLIEGAYPDYRRLIPKNKGTEVLLDRLEFTQGLRRVSVLTSARFKGVTFSFSKKKLSMEFVNTDSGEEASVTVPCEHKGSDLKVRLNSKYVLDVVSSMDKKDVQLFIKDSSSPCEFREAGKKGGSENYTCIVMPMRI